VQIKILLKNEKETKLVLGRSLYGWRADILCYLYIYESQNIYVKVRYIGKNKRQAEILYRYFCAKSDDMTDLVHQKRRGNLCKFFMNPVIIY